MASRIHREEGRRGGSFFGKAFCQQAFPKKTLLPVLPSSL